VGRKKFNVPITSESENIYSDFEMEQNMGDFHERLAYSRKKNNKDNFEIKYGFINTKGQIVIPYLYEAVPNFSNNRCAVAKRNQYNELKWAL
jgi:hypothetical protein